MWNRNTKWRDILVTFSVFCLWQAIVDSGVWMVAIVFTIGSVELDSAASRVERGTGGSKNDCK